MKSMKCKIGNVAFKNPLIAASGTFGYGKEVGDFFDINKLGGFITKTITLNPKTGNKPPRIYDLGYGVINSIGLQNPGVEVFKDKYMKFFASLKTNVIVSIYGQTISEWKQLVKSLDFKNLAGFELNFSCPNIKGKILSMDKNEAYSVVRELKKITKKIIIAKLSYSLGLKDVVKSLEKAKVSAVTLINTLPALAVDKNSKPVLGNIVGGLSGPCIKPVALRAVYEVVKCTKIPIIGCGGIMNYQDVLDFLKVGAKAVQVGTANLIDPCICERIIKDLKKYC